MKNMTALVAAFARAHHYRNNGIWVFQDEFAEKILTEEEYAAISKNMADGIDYFSPGFQGAKEDALRFVVDHQLAPSLLARSSFCENAMQNAIESGCRQIVLFASGYDTFSLRAPHSELTVYEMDKQEMIADKIKRIDSRKMKPVCHTAYIGCDLSQDPWKEKLTGAGFDPQKQSFGSLLGISYYLSKEEYQALLKNIETLWSKGSLICFDYPLADTSGAENARNRELAAAAGEQMKAEYLYSEMESMLASFGFLICEHMDAIEATESLFREYNEKVPLHRMRAPEGVGYCLAVKK